MRIGVPPHNRYYATRLVVISRFRGHLPLSIKARLVSWVGPRMLSAMYAFDVSPTIKESS